MNLNVVRVGHGLDLQKSSYICANVAYGVGESDLQRLLIFEGLRNIIK